MRHRRLAESSGSSSSDSTGSTGALSTDSDSHSDDSDSDSSDDGAAAATANHTHRRALSYAIGGIILLLLVLLGVGVWYHNRASTSTASSSAESSSTSDARLSGAAIASGISTGVSEVGEKTALSVDITETSELSATATSTGEDDSPSSDDGTDVQSSQSAVISSVTGSGSDGSAAIATTVSATAGSATASSITTSTASAASSSFTMKSCKKGVGYNDVAATKKLSICWAYNWNSDEGGSLNSEVMYIPQMWGKKMESTWSANAKSAIAAGADHLLGFNEPDLAAQADMTPSVAAAYWKTVMEPLKGSAKLISPAVTNGDQVEPAMGVPWLQQFIGNCSSCTINAVALHWYDATSNTAYFQKYLTDAHATLQKPIWLTEFMGTGNAADQATFINAVVPWLEDQDFIKKYAAFGDFQKNDIAVFVDSSNNLNDLGTAYSTAT